MSARDRELSTTADGEESQPTYQKVTESPIRRWLILDGHRLAIAAAGVVLVFLPFIVLLSYALRIATIAARTADFGPFVPRASSE